MHLFSFLLGFLIKSTFIAFYLIGFFIIILTNWRENTLKIHDNIKLILICIVIVSSILITYYLIRNSINNTYLKDVINNELIGRIRNTLEGHNEPWYFYIYKSSRELI